MHPWLIVPFIDLPSPLYNVTVVSIGSSVITLTFLSYRKTLIDQNDLLRQENLDPKAHAKRKTKCIKISGNIVIKNATSVKEIINSELPDPSLVNF
jgi:hypothetical protein